MRSQIQEMERYTLEKNSVGPHPRTTHPIRKPEEGTCVSAPLQVRC